ncbi:TadE/TadG family type IV pilus assembly protein [Pseudoblastomonas halimionae]|nr:TadE/TadG family type IV pilus assembly protein [Alteriqipengyuania halimionae]
MKDKIGERFGGLRQRLRKIWRCESGLALVEFAYVSPFLITLGLGGAELTNYALTQQRVSHLATSLADNASRAKQFVTTGDPQFREHDVHEVFAGMELQAGTLDFKKNGRAIISSLEVNADNGQWIHWQRCYGDKRSYKSAYGNEGKGSSGTGFKGMGPASNRVTADRDFAIMFVEIFYEYDPLLLGWAVEPQTLTKTAAMYVRDDRDLSQIFNPSPRATVLSC